MNAHLVVGVVSFRGGRGLAKITHAYEEISQSASKIGQMDVMHRIPRAYLQSIPVWPRPKIQEKYRDVA